MLHTGCRNVLSVMRPPETSHASTPRTFMVRLRRRPSRRAYTLVELLAAIVVIGIVAAFGIRKYGDYRERTRVNVAIMELQALQLQIATMDPMPATLAEIGRGDMKDPWGNQYVYKLFTQFAGGAPVGARKDRNLRPINEGFDLYSKGKDGDSALPLTAAKSQDDIVVANDGKFVGLASRF